MTRVLLIFLFSLLIPFMASASLHPDERMADPVLEQRAQDLYRQLRCTVCQNQSIADSNADIAADLRRLVRKELEGGKSDEQILGYIHSRYGDFVLMRPLFTPQTWVLWLAPLALLLGGGWLCWRTMQKARL